MKLLQREQTEIRAFNRSFWVGGISPMKDCDVVALIRDHDYCCTDIALMYGLSCERIRQIASRNGLRTRGSLPRLWDSSQSRFRAMTREEWQTRKRLQRKAQTYRRRHERHESERQRHVAAARQLAKELGRVPTTREVAAAVGEPITCIMQSWGYQSRKTGQQTGRKATEALYRAAGLQKRPVGSPGHIGRDAT